MRGEKLLRKIGVWFLVLTVVRGGMSGLSNTPAKPADSILPDFGDDRDTIEYLNLSAEQTAKIRRFREKLDSESAPLRVQEMERDSELRLLWFQLKPDHEKLKAKWRQIHDLKQQGQEKKVDFWIAFRSVLSPEQDARFLALVGDRVFRPPQGPPDQRGGGGRQGPRRPDDRRPPPAQDNAN